MLSPVGSGVKNNPAPSIYSIDSGYSTQALDDDHLRGSNCNPFYLQNSTSSNSLIGRLDESGGLDIRSFADIHIGEHIPHREEPIIVSTANQLNVFHTHHSTSDEFYLPELPKNESYCLECDLFECTNPGENIRCDTCRIPDLMDSSTPSSHETSKDQHTLPRLNIPNSSNSADNPPESTLSKDIRCSGCELSSLMESHGHSKCSSCRAIESDPQTSFPMSDAPMKNKIRRSRAGRASKLPLSALNTLQAWLDANSDNPYPTAQVKKQLAQQCGITEKQVTTWFTNARARQLSPLDTYLSSGSEGEGVREEDIERAADALANTGGFSYLPDTNNSNLMRAGSVVSGSSVFSNNQSRMQHSRRGKKKDYRRHKSNPISPVLQAAPNADSESNSKLLANSGEQEMWQCTFCRTHLVPKSWRRHEETQHHTRAQWTCMLYGPRLSANHGSSRPNTSSSFCAFCMLQNPSEAHFLEHHRISECAKRPVKERTFLRPDHLRQHVKNYHSSALHDMAQVRWKREGEDRADGSRGWTCGFCGDHLNTWNQRETHIANHFKEGLTMDQWYDYPAPTSTKSISKKQKKEEKKEEKGKDHMTGFARLSRTFTRRSTRSSTKSQSQSQTQTQIQIQQPESQHPQTHAHTQTQTQTFSHPYAPLTTTTTTPLSMSYQFTTAPVLPDINLDPLMGTAYTEYVDWSQMGPVQVPEPQYANQLVFDPAMQAGFDLNGMGGYGQGLEYQGPWDQGS
ncbi:hypothetical protein B0J11DRAFT_519756 [Dendryphion nanum]|uniref:Homeobox domain-containing protein n=1 Tax=Dendryphion nanum TaxID=256645 RepID=A0A9P9IUK7_9PLEO|nr:hypothetical protein B0J11DRAFT_519756 [Dendryphion nanum]